MDLRGQRERSAVFSNHLLTSSSVACIKAGSFLTELKKRRRKEKTRTKTRNELEFRVDLRRQVLNKRIQKGLLLSTGANLEQLIFLLWILWCEDPGHSLPGFLLGVPGLRSLPSSHLSGSIRDQDPYSRVSGSTHASRQLKQFLTFLSFPLFPAPSFLFLILLISHSRAQAWPGEAISQPYLHPDSCPHNEQCWLEKF